MSMQILASMDSALKDSYRGGTMPATSKRQYRFMQAVAHGNARNAPKGLSRAQAAEYVAGQSPKSLPERSSGISSYAKRKRKR